MDEIMETKEIENKIYNIRGVEVMLDSDLAEIYKCANGTKAINLAVKRNSERFPSDFYFQLNSKEVEELGSRFQFETLNSKGNLRGQNIKYLPYVFTEQGVAMLSTVLKTKVAAEVSIHIMRAFVHMRHYIKYNNQHLPNRVLLLEERVDNHTKMINELFDKFNPQEIVKDCLLFKGQIYDAYSVLLDILNMVQEEMIIIDNYVGKELLDILRKTSKRVIILSSNVDEILKNKVQKQYNNISFITNNSYHDRFIIVDKKRCFHSGASFKDLGKKCFNLHEIEDQKTIDKILKDIFNSNIKNNKEDSQ